MPGGLAGSVTGPSISQPETPLMRTTPTLARQKLLELLRLTPQANMREGYVIVFLNAADDYVRAILHDFDEPRCYPKGGCSRPERVVS